MGKGVHREHSGLCQEPTENKNEAHNLFSFVAFMPNQIENEKS